MHGNKHDIWSYIGIKSFMSGAQREERLQNNNQPCWYYNIQKFIVTSALRRHKQNLVSTRIQKNGAVMPQETEPYLPWVSRSIRQRRGSIVACYRVRGTEYNSPRSHGTYWNESFEGGWYYHHYLYHSLASVQTTGREHKPTHRQKIVLKIYWGWPFPLEQDPVSPIASTSH